MLDSFRDLDTRIFSGLGKKVDWIFLEVHAEGEWQLVMLLGGCRMSICSAGTKFSTALWPMACSTSPVHSMVGAMVQRGLQQGCSALTLCAPPPSPAAYLLPPAT